MKLLITGTSSGIGESLYKVFSSHNHNVLGISRRKTDTVDYICDFSKLDDLQDICSKIFDKHNDIDMLILNAGVLGKIEKATQLDISEIKKTFDINVFSNKIIIDNCLAKCKNIKYIIAISSGASFKGYDGWSSYCMSKSSLNQMIRCYAIENKEIKFINLAPGIVKTKMQDYIIGLPEDKFGSVSKFKALYESIPSSEKTANKIINNLKYILNNISGDYFDLRDI